MRLLGNGSAPLVLLEMPPLTYFVAGTISIPTFFRLVTEQSGLWTGAGRRASLDCLSVYSRLENHHTDAVCRSVHVRISDGASGGNPCGRASLFMNPVRRPQGRSQNDSPPAWTDAHAAPIPPVLFEMLDRILAHPRLISLKGLALEVDTKPVELIVDEFERFVGRYATVSFCPMADTPITPLHAEQRAAARARVRAEESSPGRRV